MLSPTIAHTVWGVLFGQLLMSERTVKNKIQIMIIAGLVRTYYRILT